MSTTPVFQSALRRFAPAPVAGALGKILQLEALDLLYDHLRGQQREDDFAEEVLRALHVRIRIEPEDLRRIPRTGPVVVVANHPYGMIEGAVLVALLRRVRPDFRVMANDLLGLMPELRRHLILVNPFGGAERGNARGLRAASEWLETGGLLAVFPAGEVSHLDFRRRGILDPAWHDSAVRLARRCSAPLLPVYFEGSNSALFQLAGLVHPRLRTALLPHELLNKRHRELEVRVGHPVDCAADTDELRRRTYWLARRGAHRPRMERKLVPLCRQIPPELLRHELSTLPPDRKLAVSGDLEIWQARASETPLVLREIGRLREESFRSAGEGTGQTYDLDRFDTWYTHLALWNRKSHEVVGAYRLCGTDRGRDLYTSTLFQYAPGFFDKLGCALELGRSFIRAEYQRSYQPLLLLWRGIGAYVARNPRYRFLFGPVSISAEYQPDSRALIAGYLRAHCLDTDLAPLAGGRRPFPPAPHEALPQPAGVDDLDQLVREIEPDGKGLPVLVRQYLKVGGRLCAFHLDRGFGNCLDGLIVVDLLRTERRQVERYLGAEGARAFLRHHGVGAADVQ
jgi:putative hemolysin